MDKVAATYDAHAYNIHVISHIQNTHITFTRPKKPLYEK